ncbi:hypothetical protein K435DRAFT_776725 [Dendrothele bispora CBS 962.96]|uniref:DUF4246 domain-containing protein n=1 Tax=Dendrothele bispora (strain CBS 962.96) TaxID=1314807 RepID=A0A4S8MDS2_DENBC|nr:hypothetical protein K435DRAFT_776725 [Dendrothele bispora CBS 962.96]
MSASQRENNSKLQQFIDLVHGKKEWHLQVLSERDPLVLWGLDEGLLVKPRDNGSRYGTAEDIDYGEWSFTYDGLKTEAEQLKHKLTAFSKAVRRKKEWYLKLLNPEQDLAKKWAVEAKLVASDAANIPEGPVLDVVLELKSEANRIKALDVDVINFQKPTTPRITEDQYHDIQQQVLYRIKYATSSKHGIRAPQTKENVGVLVSDGLVPEALHAELVRELNCLAAKEAEDFHPGTFGKVQDLIHPSLYPYIAGYSDVVPNASTSMPPLVEDVSRTLNSFSLKDPNPKVFETGMLVNGEKTVFRSRYSWIPTVFSVNPEGTDVHIQSYINGLGSREDHPDFYRLLEKVFLLVLPQLQKTVEISGGFKFEDSESSPSQCRWGGRCALDGQGTREDWDNLLMRQHEEKEREIQERQNIDHDAKQERQQWFTGSHTEERSSVPPDTTSTPWKGKDLKVIVKAANYILEPGQEYRGTWHIEGMPHERIVASAIYYYDTDESITDEGLSLRRFRDSDDDFPQLEYHSHETFRVQLMRPTGEENDSGRPRYVRDGDGESNYPSDWEEEEPEIYWGIHKRMSTFRISPYVKLGTVKTTGIEKDGTGRILTFPNWIQHKVEGVKHDNPGPGSGMSRPAVATRKILCFFLVDDQDLEENSGSYHALDFTDTDFINVLTTSDVPNQKRSINRATLHILLPFIASEVGKRLDRRDGAKGTHGKEFPPELVDLVWDYYDAVEKKLTRAEAEEHRRKLMEDRKMDRKINGAWDYSLCEH